MAGPIGANPLLIVGAPPSPMSSTLRQGQVIQGTIQGQPGALLLETPGLSIPLGDGAAPLLGQNVSAEVLQTRGGLQLKLAPQPATNTGTSPVNASALPKVIGIVLEALGSLEPAETAAPLVPASLPAKAPLVRTLLSIFVSRGTLATDLQTIAALTREAADAGAIPKALADAVGEAVTQTVATDEKTLRFALDRAAQHGGKNAEAVLSKALLSEMTSERQDQLSSDLRVLIGRLRETPELANRLAATGRSAEFDGATARVMDRLSASQMQNAHSNSAPYWFLEIPFNPDSPIRHAQIHVLADGGGKRRDASANDATVAFDLATSRLGDLWITLRISAGRCVCWLRPTTQDAVETLRAAANELVDGLADAGYSGATVNVTLWDGNRMAEAANLLRGLSGINVTA